MMCESLPSSFRDPSGFLFLRNGTMYRMINAVYGENYDLFMASGLYEALAADEMLVSHEEAPVPPGHDKAYKVIKPDFLPFISYPYEWCFGELRDAALLTLRIQKKSLQFGMSLKDCSAYNIQFKNCRPVFIDTLSFEKYQPGAPWIGYRQFCQHFLAPLALMAHTDVRLNQLLRIYIDGIPLDLASRLLPFRTCLSFSLLSHIHLHARAQKHFGDKSVNVRKYKMSSASLLGLIDDLESLIRGLKWQPTGTEWEDYYENVNYSREAFESKKELVGSYLERIRPAEVWDLGANSGVFSRVAAAKGSRVVSFDVDPAAVEKDYRECTKESETNILPLLLDLTNPSSGIGWANRERESFSRRGPTDAVLALALIHHLAITNNVPFRKIAEFIAGLCRHLIIEFVPKNDSQVRKLLATREDIFPEYDRESFEAAFESRFTIRGSVPVEGSERTLYLMENKVA